REMRLDADALLRRQHAVEVALHGQLGLGTGVNRRLLAHDGTATVSRDCASCVFSMRRPRWRPDITVPIGTSRMSAASWYEKSERSTSTTVSRYCGGSDASAVTMPPWLSRSIACSDSSGAVPAPSRW